MKILPVNKRRDLAFKSLACFERAVACMQSDEDSRDKLEAWSLYFMVGKVSVVSPCMFLFRQTHLNLTVI
jgi:hypothetical protein